MELSLTNLLRAKLFAHLIHHIKLSLACCDLCGSACTQTLLLCSTCQQDLPRFHLNCPVSNNINNPPDILPDLQGDLLNWPAIYKILPQHEFDHLICLAPYIEPFNQWINQFKYHHRFELAPFFAQLLADYWLQIKTRHNIAIPDVIMPVPLHINKWQSRGYNQAHLIATALADRLSITYQATSLIRTRETESQVGKTGAARRKNLHDAFSYAPEKIMMKNNTNQLTEYMIPAHVMLIDDVVTTGATVNEVSRCLKKAGVKKITIMSLCLATPN